MKWIAPSSNWGKNEKGKKKEITKDIELVDIKMKIIKLIFVFGNGLKSSIGSKRSIELKVG